MAKHYRKHSRRHRKHSRKTHRRRSHQSRQRGGAGCAAFPTTNSPFAQRGGMAPFNAPGMLLDQSTAVQAQSAQQLADIQAATTMAKAFEVSQQSGGRRRHRSRKHRKSHKRSGRAQQKSRRQHRQRGGAAQSAVYGPFDGLLQPSLIGGSPQSLGQNPQFVTEAGVNNLYGYQAGAQH